LRARFHNVPHLQLTSLRRTVLQGVPGGNRLAEQWFPPDTIER
jgi:hypothetical protein